MASLDDALCCGLQFVVRGLRLETSIFFFNLFTAAPEAITTKQWGRRASKFECGTCLSPTLAPLPFLVFFFLLLPVVVSLGQPPLVWGLKGCQVRTSRPTPEGKFALSPELLFYRAKECLVKNWAHELLYFSHLLGRLG